MDFKYEDEQKRSLGVRLDNNIVMEGRLACPSDKTFLTFMAQITNRFWNAWSNAVFRVAELQSFGKFFAAFKDVYRNILIKCPSAVQSTAQCINRCTFLHLVASSAPVFLDSEHCINKIASVLLLRAVISFAAILWGILGFKTISSYSRKHLSISIGSMYSTFAHSPVLISLSIATALHEPVHAYLFDCFDTFKANPWWATFIFMFWWKAVKIIVHTFSYVILTERKLYRPQRNPTFSPKDVTVVVPSVGSFDAIFEKCINSILQNSPGRIIVSTAGLQNMQKAKRVCEKIEENLPIQERRITVTAVNEANKRSQFIHGVIKVETPITVYADDHVFWPRTFLKHALAPFEDPLVGLVGTVKRVQRIKTGTFAERFLNYIAVMYLERHNFECTASYNLDGGVFVISGRTALARTEVLHSVDFRGGHLNETWGWGKVGPMKVDDDNFITRFMVNHGYKTVFHNEPAALMETTLGTEGGIERFSGQLLRWVRTTWRSNSTTLFSDRKLWRAHPWTTYAMIISLFFNISLIYDSLLFVVLYKSSYLKEYWYALALFLVVSKTIKQVPHLLRNPDDIWPFWVLGMLFGYVHSLFKIWALFTVGNIEWCGRRGIDPVGRPATDRSLTTGKLVTRKSWVSSLSLHNVWGQNK